MRLIRMLKATKKFSYCLKSEFTKMIPVCIEKRRTKDEVQQDCFRSVSAVKARILQYKSTDNYTITISHETCCFVPTNDVDIQLHPTNKHTNPISSKKEDAFLLKKKKRKKGMESKSVFHNRCISCEWNEHMNNTIV